MKLGSFVIKLIAKNDTSLPISHGRLLHAAFLDLVRQKDEVLSERLHDSNVKGFTMGTLTIAGGQKVGGKMMLREGDSAEWKVTSLDTELTSLLANHGLKGYARIGRAIFEILGLRENSPVNYLPGIIDMGDIPDYALQLSHLDSLTLRFMTPTSFRYYDFDYPFPKTDFIFGSLAEKWNAFSEDIVFDTENIKQLAPQYLIPIQWNGESCRVNITEKKGVTGFVGTYTFSLRQLPAEHRQVMFTLALFAMYSGVGRLAAQGMGRVRLLLEEPKYGKERHIKHIK